MEIFVDMEIFYAGRCGDKAYMHSVHHMRHINTYTNDYVIDLFIHICMYVNSTHNRFS